MRRLTTAAGAATLILLLWSVASAQDKTKNYKELDQDALKLFKDGKYEEARKIWQYIHSDYSRAEFRDLRDQDPRFIAWTNAFHMSIIRQAFAHKQFLLQSPDPKVKEKADTGYANAVEQAREMMRRSNVPKAAQDKLIKAATDPLLDALKKKDQPDKK